jgi:type II secretory pathway pseudopilin PulG
MKQHARGISIIENIIYISILALITISIVVGILQIAKIFGRARNERKATLAAETALEKIVREVRLARGILCLAAADCSTPVINATGAVLQLDSYQDYKAQAQKNKEIKFISNKIVFDPDTSAAGDAQDWTSNDVVISGGLFTKLENTDESDAASSHAIRVELQVTAGSGSYQVSHQYSAAVILRGSYNND